MPRTLDPILEAAMENIAGEVIFRGFIGYEDGDIAVQKTTIRHKITGTTLEFEIEGLGTIASDVESIWFKRGLKINGIEYLVATSRFFLQSLEATQNLTTIAKGTIMPPRYISIAGDDTYRNVITNFCAEFGKTAVFKNPDDAHWDYQFLPTGKLVILNDAMRFINMLRQKYLIFACDNGNEEILFYHTKTIASIDHSLNVEANFSYKENLNKKRQFLWRDELGTTHTDGSATAPIHNLGYLESTDNPPALNIPYPQFSSVLSPNLTILDGDVIEANFSTITIPTYILVEEEFNQNSKSPTWKTSIIGNEIFGNTEGGSVPSTIERVSNYTPLNTSTFDGNLDETVNNLQALAEAVDELELGSAPATTAANDFQVGDGAGNWITKTLAQAKTILGIFADAASDGIYYVRRNAGWTNLRSYTDTLYATLSHSHDYIPTDGWIPISSTWTRTGDHTFTITGDVTAIYRKGTKIRYKDGGSYEYGVVGASSYSSPNTTITLITNSDYAMAAATITDKYISFVENPEGWVDWFNWSPSFGGFSANPANGIYRWRAYAQTIKCFIRQPSTGTSNNTTFTISAPIQAATITNMQWGVMASVTDNGVFLTTPGVIRIASGGTNFDVFTDASLAAFTNTGTKRVYSSNIEYQY